MGHQHGRRFIFLGQQYGRRDRRYLKRSALVNIRRKVVSPLMSFTQGRTGKWESLQFKIKKIDVKGKSIRTYDLHYHYTTLTVH